MTNLGMLILCMYCWYRLDLCEWCGTCGGYVK